MNLIARTECVSDPELPEVHRRTILLNQLPDSIPSGTLEITNEVASIETDQVAWTAASVLLVRNVFGGELPDGPLYREIQIVLGQRGKEPRIGSLTLPGGRSELLTREKAQQLRLDHLSAATLSNPLASDIPQPIFRQVPGGSDDNPYYLEPPSFTASRELREETGIYVPPWILEDRQTFGYFYDHHHLLIFLHMLPRFREYPIPAHQADSDLVQPDWNTIGRYIKAREHVLPMIPRDLTPAAHKLLEYALTRAALISTEELFPPRFEY